MKKIKLEAIGQAIIFTLAAILLFITFYNNQQSMMSIPIKLDFVGEYSIDNGNSWKTLDSDTKLSALDGDLILRGSFEKEFPEGIQLNFYLNHIYMDIYVNGEHSFIDCRNELGLIPSVCCRQWIDWITPNITKNDVIEIKLKNPHKAGNSDAYNEFLNSIYTGDIYVFNGYMLKTGQASRIVGFAIIVVAVMLLGIALASKLLQNNIGKSLEKLGFFTAFTGGCFIFDTKDVSLWSHSNIINTYTLQLCIMLSVFCLTMCIASYIKTKAKKAANAAVLLSFIVNITLLLLSVFGYMVIYDTMIYWIIAHIFIFAVLLCCLIFEYVYSDKKEYIVIFSYILLICANLLDIAGIKIQIWQLDICSKITFLILFLIHIIRMIKVIPTNYRSAIQAEKIAKELQNSRISIMLSQIKPHFLHNCINAIRELCRQNQDKAREALGDFSDYLRLNMESINSEELIHFSRELKHIKKYLKLEKMRFEDDLNIVYDIKYDDFFIPPLVIQPLVENAVKHGVCESENGGTVTIHTEKKDDEIIIIITDDGVGFDINTLDKCDKKHIGIQNVRKRLEYMIGGTLEIRSDVGKGTTAIIKFKR